MKPLRVGTLIATVLVVGVLSWGGFRLWDSVGTLPQVPTAAPVVLAVIAVALAATTLSLRSRLRAQRARVPGARGVNPLAAARAVMFGQASALVASAVIGAYGGLGVFLVSGPLDASARRDEALLCLYSVLAGLAVVVVGLLLQRVCRLPDDDDDDEHGKAERRPRERQQQSHR